MIALVPQLTRIDSKDVSPSDRIKAAQALKSNLKSLEEFVADLEVNPPKEKKFSKEDRKQMFREEMEEKEREARKERERQKPKFEVVTKRKGDPKFKQNGERRMCNEFKCNWTMEEYDHPELSELRLDLPKFLETSEIDVELTGKWVAVMARGDLFQMKLWEEVYSNPVKLQRSAITGQLYIQMRKKQVDPLLKRKQELEEQEKAARAERERKEAQKRREEADAERHFRQRQIKKVYGGFLDCEKEEVSFDENDLDDLEGLSAKSLESLD